MQVIFEPRQVGKTTKMIKLADKCDGYIVCLSQQECARIAKQAREMGCDINYPLTFAEFLEGKYHGKGIRKVHIDNADLLLGQISNVEIKSISLTRDKEL